MPASPTIVRLPSGMLCSRRSAPVRVVCPDGRVVLPDAAGMTEVIAEEGEPDLVRRTAAKFGVWGR
jgi:hypothetical protein